MRITCEKTRHYSHPERGFYTSGALYDYVTDRHPIGSPAESLRSYLEHTGFEIYRCNNAQHAVLQQTTAPFVDTQVEIAWRQDKQGHITEIGVRRGNQGL